MSDPMMRRVVLARLGPYGLGLVALALAAVLLAGCMTNLTATVIRRTPDGALEIESPKDVQIGSLAVETRPDGTYRVEVEDYSSAANVDIVNAQTARESAQRAGMIEAMKAGAGLLGSAAGAAGKTVAPGL